MNLPVNASCDAPVITPDVERPTEGDIVIEKVNQNYQNRIFMPPRSKIGGGGHIVVVLSVILSFCNSVLLSETLTFLITFEQ